MKKLETLEEFNNRMHKSYVAADSATHWNGIKCPRCGKELYDTAPHHLLLSYPPQTRIACVGCAYEGTRIA